MPVQKRQNRKEEVQISLLPEQNGAKGLESRIRGILIGIAVTLVVVIAAVSLFLRARAKIYRQEAARLESSTSAAKAALQEETRKAQEIGNLGQRAGVAKSVLENHIASEKALLFLEASTIPEVVINQFAFDAAGSFVLSGRGTPFSALTRPFPAWQDHSRVREV